MSVSDPIGDMLTRIRNACMARHVVVNIPASKMKMAIADILKREGFIKDYTLIEGKPFSTIAITLKYMSDRRPAITGLRRVSKPGLRIYTKRDEIPRVRGGLGLSILSTPKGVLAGHEAWQERVGGEVLCYIW
ncbi:30S ribosomal protein S8 [Oscillochloris sp. ZM17-4]|uniref:30S ribosomal protein S8 n=1 Tax=Oscillochloris sp. ZM17-4 TaxID=2866714 RepID=UPI001C734E0F|nr:30S ribosomal protein S8 [Oscillochloris sp. ZM17-4]